MKFPPAPALKPLDLSRTPRVAPRHLAAGDLSPAARLTKPTSSEHQRITKQTEKWVSQTFFGTLLKQMEDSPFKSELFSGGRGGQAFSSMYHQHLADRIARGAGQKLVKSVVRRIEANAAYRKQKAPSSSNAVAPVVPTRAGRGTRNHSGPSTGRRDVAADARA